MSNSEQRIEPHRLFYHSSQVFLVIEILRELSSDLRMLCKNHQQVDHRLRHLHHGCIKEHTLQIEGLLLNRQTRRKSMRNATCPELVDEESSQACALLHVAQTAALQCRHHVVGIADD